MRSAMKGLIMTDTADKRQSDQVVSDRIRFACDSLGMSDADGQDMAQRAIAMRVKAHAK
jgi:hypothetical protein